MLEMLLMRLLDLRLLVDVWLSSASPSFESCLLRRLWSHVVEKEAMSIDCAGMRIDRADLRIDRVSADDKS